MFALIVVGMAWIFYVGKKANDAKAMETRETVILQKLERILPALHAATWEQLAYVVMWKPDYRPAYRTALRTLYRNVDSLKPDLEVHAFNHMKELVHEQVHKLETTVEVRKTAPLKVTEVMMQEFTAIHEGRDPRQPLKDDLQRLKEKHEALLHDARARVARASATLSLSFFAISGVFILFTGWTYSRVVKEMNERQKASQAKDQFMAMLSHELRTPLTPVLATLSSWEDDERVPEEMREDVQIMRRNVELEARLIDDLLDVTRIAKGKLSINLEAIDVHQVLPAVVELCCGFEIEAKRLKIELKLEAQRHVVRADLARLQQVFWNIARNAAKFTPEQGRLTIRSLNEGSRMRIVFTDTGIGMTRDVLARVFEPFVQGENEISREHGLGLGMAISKNLMRLMGGEIRAHSDGPGRGSTFELEMETVDAEAATAPAGPDEDAPGAEPVSRAEAAILLVEDHADTAKLMARLLRRMGHTVQIADSVAAARRLNEMQKFDLVLSDIGLPDGTGSDLIKSIRQSHNASVPAIAMTGFGMEEDISRSLAAGFNLHLTKPVNIARLEKAIGQMLADSASSVQPVRGD
ncbi:MAG TPA: ATP-binding protein [Tepidisphaeraceae bacterium]